MLASRPGWTVAAVVCLAIATGANTAAFTIVNGLLLRPLPFDESDRLVMVALREPRQGSTRPFSLREFREPSDHAKGTSALLARTFFPLSLAIAGGEDSAPMAQAVPVAPPGGCLVDHLRDPRIRFDQQGETGGGNANDVVRAAVQCELAAEDVRFATKIALAIICDSGPLPGAVPGAALLP